MEIRLAPHPSRAQSRLEGSEAIAGPERVAQSSAPRAAGPEGAHRCRDAAKHGPLVRQGHADAQFNLGVMYREGKGVPQDYAEAVRWYRLVAEQADAGAQYSLGLIYDNGGQGVPQDYVPQDDVEAMKWWRLAAEQGDAEAQHNLGVMLYDNDGEGVPQDYVQAHIGSISQSHVILPRRRRTGTGRFAIRALIASKLRGLSRPGGASGRVPPSFISQ